MSGWTEEQKANWVDPMTANAPKGKSGVSPLLGGINAPKLGFDGKPITAAQVEGKPYAPPNKTTAAYLPQGNKNNENKMATIEEKNLPVIKKQLGKIGTGIDPATGQPSMNLAPTSLPSGTEMTYTPATVDANTLETTEGKTLGASPTATAGQVPLTGLATAVPTAAAPGSYTATTVENSVTDANAQLGSLSQGAITAPQGTVSQQALATAAQGVATQSVAPTMVMSAAEQLTAAKVSDVGGYQAATAQTMNTPQEATVQYQLQQLMTQFDNDSIPAFASGAIQHANAAMLARGLGASSMAGQAILHAAMETATAVAVQDAQVNAKFSLQNLSNKQQTAMVNAQLRATLTGQELTNEQQSRVLNAARVSEVNNLNFSAEQTVALENAKLMENMSLANLNTNQQAALQNAATLASMDTKNLDARLTTAVQNARDFLQMDMANMTNKQQSEIFNAQSKNQALLTDVASQNAASQFNATSQNQVDQFYQSLGSQISTANVNRTSAMMQYNTDQANAMSKFNVQVEDSRDKFNSEMQSQIDQSNVTWRRAVNTTNTAEQNRSNQMNAQNLLDMTQAAQNRLWNRYRDEAEWYVNIQEAREARAHQVAITAQQNNFSMTQYEDHAKDSMWMTIGAGVIDWVLK